MLLFFIFYFFNAILVCLHSFYLCMYVCMYGCVGSSFLCKGFLQLWQAGATLHRGARDSHYCGLSLPSTSSRHAGSVIVAHRPSCSAACGIFPDQGSNPRPLHWQADSQPPHHQGSPICCFLCTTFDMYACYICNGSAVTYFMQYFTICLHNSNLHGLSNLTLMVK